MARGTVRKFYTRFSCTFDRDQVRRILLQARKHNVSMTEMIRNLVEWGLEQVE